MKLTEQRIKQIIIEEIQQFQEASEVEQAIIDQSKMDTETAIQEVGAIVDQIGDVITKTLEKAAAGDKAKFEKYKELMITALPELLAK